MTTATIRPTVATRPTAPTAAPVANTPEAARWAAYLAQHEPPYRRRARADLVRRVWGLLAVAAVVTGAALLMAALPAIVAQMLTGAVAFLVAGAIPLLVVLATRPPWVEPSAPTAPPAGDFDAAWWAGWWKAQGVEPPVDNAAISDPYLVFLRSRQEQPPARD